MSKIEKLSDLKEWNRNPREIGPKALDGLKASIDEYGDLSGIVMNTRINALVCGHQRVNAIRELYGDVAVVKGDTILLPNGESFQIRFVDWDEATHAAAAVAANNPAIAGLFTKELETLLEEMKRENPIGFDRLNFDDLARELGITPPDFNPAPEEEQGRLDEKKPIICPNCKHEFTV